MIKANNKYTKMQQNQYDNDASNWSIDNRDPVVGSFDAHNNWKDYDEYLFKDVSKPLNECILLDFGCGPGRNLAKFNSQFMRLDGVDISQVNLDNAKLWLNHTESKIGNLYKNNGIDLKVVPDNTYDVIMSTICFQHICVYDIRRNYLLDFYKKLKTGGILTMQMGFGGRPSIFPTNTYYDNDYDALMTNSGFDVSIHSPDELKNDLYEIGFTKFNSYIRPVGPGDNHTNWIFFNVTK